jgi:hypothetical protein
MKLKKEPMAMKKEAMKMKKEAMKMKKEGAMQMKKEIASAMKAVKPDFPDIDGDGDRKESISKAAADKKGE